MTCRAEIREAGRRPAGIERVRLLGLKASRMYPPGLLDTRAPDKHWAVVDPSRLRAAAHASSAQTDPAARLAVRTMCSAHAHDAAGQGPKPPGRPPRTESPTQAEDEEVAAPAFRILLIEDDAVDVRLIRACVSAIESLKPTCAVVTSVAAARELLKEERFDLCITDFWLGFESSLRFVADLSAAPRRTPVIVLTSLSTPEIRRLCLQAGALNVVGKEHLSPGMIEAAIGEAVRARAAEGSRAAPQDDVPASNRSFLESFERIMHRLDEAPRTAPPRPRSGPGTGAANGMRAFMALSETARLAVLEQVVDLHGPPPHGAPSEGPDRPTDLAEAARKAGSLVTALGRSVALRAGAPALAVACAESAVIFLVLEMMNRVGELTGERTTLTVEVAPEQDDVCALRVSGPVYGGTPALPVTFGSLFMSILRCCHGLVEMSHDAGSSITLVARLAGAPGSFTSTRQH